jgi:tetratricopeptide (TPR) repeat protein
MTGQHPDRAMLDRFLDDDLSEEESRALQRHIFTCEACEASMIRLLPPLSVAGSLLPSLASPGAGVPEAAAGGCRCVLDTASLERQRERIAGERREADELWRELSGHEPERRSFLVRTDRRFQTWGVFDLLLRHGREVTFENPAAAGAILRLALESAERLDPERYGTGSVAAARARAWGGLGNTLRILADFRGAEQALLEAEEHLARSWMDPLDEAMLLEYKAALRRAQGHFGESLAMLDEAIGLYRGVNEPHLQGRALISKGLVLQYAGGLEPASACFRRGLFLIDPEEEPRLMVCAQHNLVFCLHESGRSREARALIANAREVWAGRATRTDLLRLSWLESRVERALGREDRAERILIEVRAAFVEEGLAYDAALVCLDLAALLAGQARTAEVKALAEEMLPIFRSRDVHREALAALLVFENAARMEQLTTSLVDEVASYLERARGNPSLRFRDAHEPKTVVS